MLNYEQENKWRKKLTWIHGLRWSSAKHRHMLHACLPNTRDSDPTSPEHRTPLQHSRTSPSVAETNMTKVWKYFSLQTRVGARDYTSSLELYRVIRYHKGTVVSRTWLHSSSLHCFDSRKGLWPLKILHQWSQSFSSGDLALPGVISER